MRISQILTQRRKNAKDCSHEWGAVYSHKKTQGIYLKSFQLSMVDNHEQAQKTQ